MRAPNRSIHASPHSCASIHSCSNLPAVCMQEDDKPNSVRAQHRSAHFCRVLHLSGRRTNDRRTYSNRYAGSWPRLFLIAIAAVAVWGFRAQEATVDVLTAPATYQDLSQQVTTNGTVSPTSEFQARAFWPGIIDKVNVELGEKVQPGQLLVSMKDPIRDFPDDGGQRRFAGMAAERREHP